MILWRHWQAKSNKFLGWFRLIYKWWFKSTSWTQDPHLHPLGDCVVVWQDVISFCHVTSAGDDVGRLVERRTELQTLSESEINYLKYYWKNPGNFSVISCVDAYKFKYLNFPYYSFWFLHSSMSNIFSVEEHFAPLTRHSLESTLGYILSLFWGSTLVVWEYIEKVNT